MTEIKLIKGDITHMDVDAIVNSANSELLINESMPNGGVDRAIHAAAGPELYQECKQLGGCDSGEAKITKGYRLQAKHVIHAVGPIHSGQPKDSENLQNAYLSALKLAKENGIKTIAFPAISTGAYGYPKAEAAPIAINTVNKYLQENPGVFDTVYYVMHNPENYDIYNKLLNL
jgi:O-acetyl-ADP-ribose deacetylase